MVHKATCVGLWASRRPSVYQRLDQVKKNRNGWLYDLFQVTNELRERSSSANLHDLAIWEQKVGKWQLILMSLLSKHRLLTLEAYITHISY